ncbi:MAG: dTMP kinase [Deltaproteobacteria bacterium]|nr:dTMP kinase [Deltaproteobacteria bacterium]
MPTGHFITLEGIEGCGKSTQIKHLETALRTKKFNVVLTKEPGGTKIGQEIRKLLLHADRTEMASLTELFLYAADRHQHLQEIVLPAIQSGKIVLSDRYADATTAYQGGGRGIDSKLLAQLHQQATNNLQPNLTILLDLPVEVGMERIAKRNLDRLENEKNNFHEAVRQGYLAIAKKEPKRVKVVDATQPVETVHAVILKEVLKVCGQP